MSQFRVEARNGFAIVQGRGELDAFSAPELERIVEEVRDAGRVVLDLERVSFLDSTILGLVVRCSREVDARGGAMRVVLPANSARRIFEITTLDRVLPVAASCETAVTELADG
jgi:anti-anti-sigma factor